MHQRALNARLTGGVKRILAYFTLCDVVKGSEQVMTRPLDQIDEVIHNPKHPFRQVADRPEKPQKHRYERRKVKEIIRAGEWSSKPI